MRKAAYVSSVLDVFNAGECFIFMLILGIVKPATAPREMA